MNHECFDFMNDEPWAWVFVYSLVFVVLCSLSQCASKFDQRRSEYASMTDITSATPAQLEDAVGTMIFFAGSTIGEELVDQQTGVIATGHALRREASVYREVRQPEKPEIEWKAKYESHSQADGWSTKYPTTSSAVYGETLQKSLETRIAPNLVLSSRFSTPSNMTNLFINQIPEKLRNLPHFQLTEDSIYLGENVQKPKSGDIKLHYTYLPAYEISVVGMLRRLEKSSDFIIVPYVREFGIGSVDLSQTRFKIEDMLAWQKDLQGHGFIYFVGIILRFIALGVFIFDLVAIIKATKVNVWIARTMQS